MKKIFILFRRERRSSRIRVLNADPIRKKTFSSIEKKRRSIIINKQEITKKYFFDLS